MKYKKVIKIIYVLIIAIIINANFTYARLVGKNNNKNSFMSDLNNSLDRVANHFVDSVVNDDIEDKKYKGLEANEVMHLKRIEAIKATLSNVNIGEYVYFGNIIPEDYDLSKIDDQFINDIYDGEINKNNDFQKIKWFVFDKNVDYLYLITDLPIDNFYNNATSSEIDSFLLLMVKIGDNYKNIIFDKEEMQIIKNKTIVSKNSEKVLQMQLKIR